MQHKSTSKHLAFALKDIHHLDILKFYFLIKCLLHCVHVCVKENLKKLLCFIFVKMRFLKSLAVYQKNAFLKKHFEKRIFKEAFRNSY